MAGPRIRPAFSFLFGAWRSRPKSRKILWVLSVLMALSGTGMLSYSFLTDLYADRKQDTLATEFESPDLRARFLTGDIVTGQVLTRLRIPSVGIDSLVVEGTDPGDLRAGVGHYEGTAMPCESGNVGIAGHRTTYGAPFNRVDEIRPGDEIELITPARRCTYRVVEAPSGTRTANKLGAAWVTHPADVGVLSRTATSSITLTSCHPKGSARQRIILRAELEASAPV